MVNQSSPVRLRIARELILRVDEGDNVVAVGKKSVGFKLDRHQARRQVFEERTQFLPSPVDAGHVWCRATQYMVGGI